MRLHLRAPSHTTFVLLPTFMYRYSPQPRLVNRKSKSAAAVPTRGSSMRCKIVWSCAHVRRGIFVYCILFFFVSIFSVVASSNFSPQLLFSLGWALGLTRLSEVKGIYGNDALLRPRMRKTNNGIKQKSVKGCCYHYGSPGVIF